MKKSSKAAAVITKTRYYRVAEGWEVKGYTDRYLRLPVRWKSQGHPIPVAYASDRCWEYDSETDSVRYLKHENGVNRPVDLKEFTMVQLAAKEYIL